MKRIALIDADIVAYQLAATAQRSYKFPGLEGPAVAVDDWEAQPERIDDEVAKLRAAVKADEVIICLSCPTADNFRLDVLPTYKANREGVVKPEHLVAVKDHLEATYWSYRRPRLEADDIMGILSTHPDLVPGKKVIVSEDKDMKTIPGWLYNPRKDKKPWLVSPEEADYWHLYQTLIGDSVDGYTGLPGCGPKGAVKILGEPSARKYIHIHEVWPRIVEAYEAKGLTEADALVQARVARICRASDYSFDRKEVILWTP